MAHSLPPWTSKYRMAKIFGQIDSGELAVRLGSVNAFDRRGNVLWMEDFSNGVLEMRWQSNGANGLVDLSTERSLTKGVSCRMRTGDAQFDYAYIFRALAYPYVGKVGLEVSTTTTTNIKEFGIEIRVWDGTDRKIAGVEYWDLHTSLLYLKKGASYYGFQTVTPLINNDWVFNNFKLVVDFNSGHYMRFLFNETEYDMSSYEYQQVADATRPYMEVRFWTRADIDNGVTSYVDHVIVTMNEV